MRKLLTLLFATLLVGLTSGCITKLNSERAPGTDLGALQTIHVVKLPVDERGIEVLIADRLNLMGRHATYGERSEMPADTQAIMTYQDKWMWDMTMYMIELHVQVRKPENGAVMATGHSMRTSLARKSPPEMVKEVLTDLFAQP